jgi:secondary thiamine-phosphate synthase enzyme
MRQYQQTIQIQGERRGLTEITAAIANIVAAAEIGTGLCTLFVRHTSASLTIQENADPSARRDLETFLERIAPENDPAYTHTDEGADDMPAHLRAMLTDSSLTIPITGGRLALGTWQGIFLCEHRRRVPSRSLVVHLLGE